MDQSACKLTLIYPSASETHIVDLLTGSEPPLPGLTILRADGHGHSFSGATVRERVRGRVARGVLMLALPRARVAPLLEQIRTEAAIPDLVYWIEPIEAFGCLAPAEADSVRVAA